MFEVHDQEKTEAAAVETGTVTEAGSLTETGTVTEAGSLTETGTLKEAGGPVEAASLTEAGQSPGQEAEEDRPAERKRPDWKRYLVYFAGYTAVFCLLAAAVFVWFWIRKRRFVWKTDGINQHYYGLLFFARWGREVIRQFRETHVLRLPTFTMRMGYGEDLYTTLAYYVIGDPFNLPAVFVPEKYLLAFHDVMLMARFYLAGITFSLYSFYMGRKSRIGVLAGALVYVFNGFTLSGMRHHYFLNPFVLFPLLLIGCERIFRKKKPGLYIFMVFLAAVSNFYFFYMMVFMTVLYAVWRSLRLRGLRQFGRVLLDGLSFVGYGLLGTMLSAFLFLPVVLRFLQDPRTADEKTIPLLWPVTYYQNFLDSFLTNGSSALADSWTYMGFGAVAAFCVLFIFAQRKKHFDLKAAFVGLTALLLTPAAGYVLNGFSYPANRWMWAYALLIGLMTASAVPELAEAGMKSFLAALLLLAAVVAVCAGWHYTFSKETALAVVIALFGAAAVLVLRVMRMEAERESSGAAEGSAESSGVKEGTAEFSGPEAERTAVPGTNKTNGSVGAAAAVREAAGETGAADADRNTGREGLRRKYLIRAQAVLLVCVMVTIAASGWFTFAPSGGSGVFEYLSRAQIDLQTSRDAAAAAELLGSGLKGPNDAVAKGTAVGGKEKAAEADAADGASTEFYRYTTFNPENNTSILYGVSNTQYYWSLSNPDISQFLNETGQLNKMIHQYDTLDDRTALNEIMGIRYFLAENSDGLPFGYEKVEGLSYSNADLWPENDSADRYSCEVYENKYALPFGFTTDRWISREDYQRLDIPQRQQALMQGIVLERDPGDSFTKLKADSSSYSVEGAGADAGQMVLSDRRMKVQYEIEKDLVSEMDLPKDGSGPLRLVTSEGGAHLTIRFKGLPDCETSLYIRGMHYTPPEGRLGASKLLMSVRGYSGEQRCCDKQMGYTTERDRWATGRRDFLINMRYREETLDRISLTLPAAGTYTFDAVEVVCQPMSEYPAQAEALRKDSMTGLDLHEMGDSLATEKITGTVKLQKPGILCLQIPKTAGWTAYVDGVRTELLQADTMFSALLLTAGSHDIELRYQTPGLRLGAAISAGTLLVIVLFCLIYLIVSLILHAAERRKEAIPEGTYENVASEDNPDPQSIKEAE